MRVWRFDPSLSYGRGGRTEKNLCQALPLSEESLLSDESDEEEDDDDVSSESQPPRPPPPFTGTSGPVFFGVPPAAADADMAAGAPRSAPSSSN
jgi:hypothetical protein